MWNPKACPGSCKVVLFRNVSFVHRQRLRGHGYLDPGTSFLSLLHADQYRREEALLPQQRVPIVWSVS